MLNSKGGSGSESGSVSNGRVRSDPTWKHCSSGGLSLRGVRGPLDRFFPSQGNDHGKGHLPLKDAKEASKLVTLDVGRFFFENGIPFNVASSPSFVSLLRSVGDYGRGYKAPSPHDLSSWVLQTEVETTRKIVEDVRKTWKATGVTIMSDGWTDIRGRSLLNFLVNNPKGTVFLKSTDASDAVKDTRLIFKLLDSVVEEVRKDIVVQVVIDNASAYKAVGRLLIEKRKHLYWTPCAAHCIDLILEDIGKLTLLGLCSIARV
ncbi:hypothetical protein Q3G72_024769 [Acer saccharum]|nr:hypothetical protein Q3G72_024769 [Acer saccharum]